jgi:branched-subunit amino acid transport protein
MSTWIVLLAVGAGTYALRASMFVVLGRRSLPGWTERPMALVAPAAIAALTVSMLLTSRQSVDAAPTKELLAVLVGFLTVRRTGNVMWAFVAGLPVYWLTALVIG